MYFFSPLMWYPPERCDLKYDFDLDKTRSELPRLENSRAKLCGYEFFKQPLADGILVSRTLLESSTNVNKNDQGVYKIRVGNTIYDSILDYCSTRNRLVPSFADPGTWTYVNHFKLPDYLYDTEDLIDYYNHLQFDLAGSTDWPIVDKNVNITDGKRRFIELDTKIKEHRRHLTLELAQDFITKCNKREQLNFIPFGTIQGYSESTYRKSLQVLLKMGYRYIAIGGLPAYSEQKVVELLPMIYEELQRADILPGMHLYGRFPSPKNVGFYLEHGVTSFDNNSAFISASRSPCVYYDPRFKTEMDSPMFKCYGVKIPPPNGPMLTRLRKKDKVLYEKLSKKCETAFKYFVRYSQKSTPKRLEKFLSKYDIMNIGLNDARSKPLSEKNLKENFERCNSALKERGWERCGCTSCKMLRAHITLVRGPRIPHIFLHNQHVQYTRFSTELRKAKNNVDYTQYNWKFIETLNHLKANRNSIKN